MKGKQTAERPMCQGCSTGGGIKASDSLTSDFGQHRNGLGWFGAERGRQKLVASLDSYPVVGVASNGVIKHHLPGKDSTDPIHQKMSRATINHTTYLCAAGRTVKRVVEENPIARGAASKSLRRTPLYRY